MSDLDALSPERGVNFALIPKSPRAEKSETKRQLRRSKRPNDHPKSDRTRITISLSERTMMAFDELKRLTDADTDSEVFRNALRLHAALLHAHIAGDTLLIRRKNESETSAVALFIPIDDANPNRPTNGPTHLRAGTKDHGHGEG